MLLGPASGVYVDESYPYELGPLNVSTFTYAPSLRPLNPPVMRTKSIPIFSMSSLFTFLFFLLQCSLPCSRTSTPSSTSWRVSVESFPVLSMTSSARSSHLTGATVFQYEFIALFIYDMFFCRYVVFAPWPLAGDEGISLRPEDHLDNIDWVAIWWNLLYPNVNSSILICLFVVGWKRGSRLERKFSVVRPLVDRLPLGRLQRWSHHCLQQNRLCQGLF